MGGKILRNILIILVLFFAFQVLGYDNLKTHPLLSESAAAIYNQRTSLKLTDQQKSWIIKGSIDEDTDPRYLNHFYDPITGKGLNGYDKVGNLIFKAQGQSAKAWAKNQNTSTGDYSEAAILKNYQDGNLTRAYQGIGHILHLIQDMAVPAHTRNDPHAGGDPYENWAEKYGTINPVKLSFLSVNNLDQVFDQVANYSNNNFFSKDTVGGNLLVDIKKFVREKDVDGNMAEYGYLNNYKLVKIIRGIDNNKYQLDFKNHQDYWNMLYPKAVGYSAGVIDYFVKKFEQIDKSKKEQEKISVWGKLKNSLAWLKNEAQYSWGEVVISQRNVLASGYDKVTAAVTNTQDNFQNFSDANREIVEGAAKQAGQVLSAFEQSAENTAAPETNQVENNENQVAPIQPDNGGPINVAPSPAPIELAPDPIAQPIEQIFLPLPEEQEDPSPAPENQPAAAQPAPTFIFVAGDSTPPETTITSGPNQIINLNSANFIFTSNEINSTFDCNLNDNGWEVCTAPRNLINLSDRGYIFKVRARDNSNNIDQTPAEHSWTVDTTAPQITLVSGPQDIASSTTANFQFNSSEDDIAYECQLDANPWQTCAASTSAADLIEGEHILKTKGTDQAGNTGSSTLISWLVDLTAATSTMAGLEATHETTGFTVSWSGEDMDATGSTTPASGLADFDVQYKIGASDWQDWINATTSTSTIFNLAVSGGQTIYFHVRASDRAGNLGNWSEAVQTAISDHSADHLVISEVQVGGGVANDEFIELYNPTDADINLSGYSIQYRGGGAQSFYKKNFLADSIIKAKKYFLIASSEYDGSASADFTYGGFSLAATGGTIFLANTHDELTDNTATSTIVIDRLAYGSGSYLFPEGTAYAASPAANKSLERKANATSTAETMAAGGAHENLGNNYDSDNNSDDFVLEVSPDPVGSYIYDIVRDDVTEPSNFGRDYIFTDFRPAASKLSGLAIKTTTSRASGNFNITLCKGIITTDNYTTKANCGSDVLITQKTCNISNSTDLNAWQYCDFDPPFYLTPGADYYLVVNGGLWVGTSYSNTDYGVNVACGFNSGGIDQYCLSGRWKGFLSLKTYAR